MWLSGEGVGEYLLGSAADAFGERLLADPEFPRQGIEIRFPWGGEVAPFDREQERLALFGGQIEDAALEGFLGECVHPLHVDRDLVFGAVVVELADLLMVEKPQSEQLGPITVRLENRCARLVESFEEVVALASPLDSIQGMVANGLDYLEVLDVGALPDRLGKPLV